jgi:dihydroflavonol-4-reductase
MSDKPSLLITGVSGFIGLWVAKEAIESKKYKVFGSVRDAKNEKGTKKIREALGDLGDQISFRSLNLDDQASIEKAVEGMQYILHLASPFPAESPKNEDEIIVPAVNGTKFVVEAAAKHKVKRVVITSSVAAILDHTKGTIEVDEKSWPSNADDLPAYYKSKIQAERAAWKFNEEQKGDHIVEIITVNPGVVTGPILSSTGGTSQKIFMDIMIGEMMSIPKTYMPIVDVRDVAKGHLAALQKGKAGERYALVEKTIFMPELGQVLYEEFNQYGYKCTNGEMCLATIWLGSFFSEDAKGFYNDWNINCSINNEKSKKDLGLTYTTNKKSLTDMGYSFIKMGVVEDKVKAADKDKNSEAGDEDHKEEVKK